MSSPSSGCLQEEEDIPLKKEKTHFTVRLTEMKASDKVKLIKEVKNFVPGVNLVQVRRELPQGPATLPPSPGGSWSTLPAAAVVLCSKGSQDRCVQETACALPSARRGGRGAGQEPVVSLQIAVPSQLCCEPLAEAEG